MRILIEFSKIWGQDDHRWNYCGGDYNFHTMHGFMEFYGIKEAWIIGRCEYWKTDDENEVGIPCNEYAGWATKEIERLKRHWRVDPCKPCIGLNVVAYA